jgi:hypothetical protein
MVFMAFFPFVKFAVSETGHRIVRETLKFQVAFVIATLHENEVSTKRTISARTAREDLFAILAHGASDESFTCAETGDLVAKGSVVGFDSRDPSAQVFVFLLQTLHFGADCGRERSRGFKGCAEFVHVVAEVVGRILHAYSISWDRTFVKPKRKKLFSQLPDLQGFMENMKNLRKAGLRVSPKPRV